ncbi:hypothetical protein A0J61_11171, partial [Choanephora cucurbitarum]
MTSDEEMRLMRQQLLETQNLTIELSSSLTMPEAKRSIYTSQAKEDAILTQIQYLLSSILCLLDILAIEDFRTLILNVNADISASGTGVAFRAINPTSDSSIGVTSLPGRLNSMAKEISFALGNQDRAKYQLNATKASLGISKSTDFLGDLSKIKKEYEGYITYAQVANDK